MKSIRKTTHPGIAQAIKACVPPTQEALAEKIGVSQSFVSEMLNRRRPVPPTLCRVIEAAVGGAVPRHELRPDVFDPPSDSAAA